MPAYWLAGANVSVPTGTGAVAKKGSADEYRDGDEGALLWQAIVEATLWDHPQPPDLERHVDQQGNPQYAPDLSCEESSGCATYPMLVRDRPPNEFVWQIDPTKLAGGNNRPAEQPSTYFGGAFITPYYVWQSKGLF